VNDMLILDDLLTPEEKLIRDSVRQFVEAEVLDLLPEAYEAGHFPLELIPKLAELGLLGMSLPEEYGGSGAGAVSYGLVCQELERGDSGLRSFVSVQSSLCIRFFSLARKRRKNAFCRLCHAAKLSVVLA
jgi:glutaryl-CoA dehydrogenase